MTKSLWVVSSVALLCLSAAAVRAESYDGRWEVRTNKASCGRLGLPTDVFITGTVKGSVFTATVYYARGAGAPVDIQIAADGSFHHNQGGVFVDGKFAGDKLSVDVKSSICPERTGAGGRVP